MSFIYYLVIIPILIILFLLSSIYSGCETAYSTLPKSKIYEMVENKETSNKLISKHYNKYNRILTTILIGNNLVNVISSVLMGVFLGKLFTDETLIIIISTAIVTPLLVIFGEITPKLLARKNPKKFLQIFSWWIDLNYWVFWILTWPIHKLSKDVYITNSEEDLKSIINLAQSEGVLQTGESLLAKNALDLDSTKVLSHYIKLKEVTTLSYKANVSEAIHLFKETNYSRIPVEQNGQLIGILLLKDIFHLKKGKIINYIKRVPLISSNSILSSALEKMRAARAQMGFVVENNNSTDVIGIITIEDIIEEIIGEIYDEYDDDEKIYEISLEKSRVRGDTLIGELFKQLELDPSLLEENEEQLTLYQWFAKKINKPKLYKTSKYTLKDKVSFKVLETNKNKESETLIEVYIE
ncbi:CNNM domain-containing protein [Mycoplasmopsis felis]|uniref:CNNM domain-containing protein n=1 Tax=Mycoplasmopsis felis TaxID=33923 RepID=UPI002B000F6B|nr:CNNM domain-containing protein [Mycoplasmopsis felis]WQQ06360.1 CNNM domain-containing protein [Mycoplasmopsis felis]WQQ11901.1 CNNM domain-containing protein [Mycoplasmopsis felis]